MQDRWDRWRIIAGCSVLMALPACGAPQARRVRRPSEPAASQTLVAWTESFDRLDPAHWREVAVKRHTDYGAVTVDGRACLRAHSRDGASILLHAMQVDPSAHPWLSWEWRVDRPVEGEALMEQRGSDAAARVYIYFKTVGLPWQQRSLDYVWSTTLPVGTLLNSAYSSVSKIIVADGGADAMGRWRRVERNLRDDFYRAFGEPAPAIVALGIMTDTDTLRGEALAYFDDFRLSREPMTTDGR